MMTEEKPTANLRFKNGVLQQFFELTSFDQDTSGNSQPKTYEWRDVPGQEAVPPSISHPTENIEPGA